MKKVLITKRDLPISLRETYLVKRDGLSLLVPTSIRPKPAQIPGPSLPAPEIPTVMCEVLHEAHELCIVRSDIDGEIYTLDTSRLITMTEATATEQRVFDFLTELSQSGCAVNQYHLDAANYFFANDGERLKKLAPDYEEQQPLAPPAHPVCGNCDNFHDGTCGISPDEVDKLEGDSCTQYHYNGIDDK